MNDSHYIDGVCSELPGAETHVSRLRNLLFEIKVLYLVYLLHREGKIHHVLYYSNMPVVISCGGGGEGVRVSTQSAASLVWLSMCVCVHS